MRLDRWFKRHLPQVTQGMLQKALRKGDVRVDGQKADASDRTKAGQMVTVAEFMLKVAAIKPPKPTISEDQIVEIRRWVIYKDKNVIAINKPAGIAVQGGTGQHTSVDALLDGLILDSNERPKLVHRLDKDTSGVLLLARSAKAARALAEAFAGKEIEKTYWALVVGVPEIESGKIDMPLAKLMRGKDSRTGVATDEYMGVDDNEGKRAITFYRVIEPLAKQLSWVELFPLTGRTHQLRVHMAEIGHPIIGDGKYGGSDAFIEGGIELPKQLHLHARRIVIEDIFGGTLEVEAPLSPHMRESWKLLGLEEK
jgi:23S rRNA pseudouridine955/2504/2580 synthase